MTLQKDSRRYIDLTHPLSPDIPSWDGEPCFGLSTIIDYNACTPPDLFRIQRIEARAGAGTHIDAPAHCIPGGKTIDNLNLEELAVSGVVINIAHKAHESYLIMPTAIKQFEKEHGRIGQNVFVIFYTGWDQYWNTPVKYHNSHKFPSIHADTAAMLLERNIAGLGIDTLSPDRGDGGFPVHQIILGAGKYIVENIANAKSLPSTGSRIIISPLKIKGGTEAPIRLMAMV